MKDTNNIRFVKLKECKVFWRCEFHKAGCKGRTTSVGEAIDFLDAIKYQTGL